MKKTMKLIDRIMLVNMLPEKGTFEELIICEDIKNKIAITQDEVKDFEIKTIDGNVNWNSKGVESNKVIEFSDLENDKIKALLISVSEKKEASREMLQLYRTFCL